MYANEYLKFKERAIASKLHCTIVKIHNKSFFLSEVMVLHVALCDVPCSAEILDYHFSLCPIVLVH